MQAPIPYAENDEKISRNERTTHKNLAKTFRRIISTTHRDTHHAERGVHAKGHALLKGEISIHPDLPDELAQGLFATPKTYPAFVRLSTIPGDVLKDSVSVPRGFALKITNIDGELLADAKGNAVQDFLFASGEAFAVSRAKSFLYAMRVFSLTTDRAEWAKIALSRVLRVINAGLEKIGARNDVIDFIGGFAPTNPLGERFYTQVPLRYGNYVAKFDIVPASENFRALTGKTVAVDHDADAIRHAVHNVLQKDGGAWTLRAQLRRDAARNPIENASVAWPEEGSPYLPIATITVLPQESWSEALLREMDDSISFAPWHGLKAHQPLGDIMRARRSSYPMSAQLRTRLNGCPLHLIPRIK
ncbi:catalase family protein [Kozakia baliensis]|uniref:catalase family protein n=1 Tax=Kozakia baliensis TaxID=153496 RepID=UPI00087D9A00|nr:catalase family protein [Kozakia baliensis]AOX19936.1 catalase [Kozakia baliensis]